MTRSPIPLTTVITPESHLNSKSIQEKATEIAARLKAAPFYDENDSDLFWGVDELTDIGTSTSPVGVLIEEFDSVWSGLYDWADANFVWLDVWDHNPKQVYA